MIAVQRFYWLLAFLVAHAVCSQAEDVGRSGTYLIHSCGGGVPNRKAAQLRALLSQIYNNLQAVIADASLGTASRHGYAAFFEDNSQTSFVQGVYRNIANGGPVPIGTARGRTTNPLVNLGLPTIVCITADNLAVAGIMQCCDKGIGAGVQGNLVAVCPSFWALGMSFPAKSLLMYPCRSCKTRLASIYSVAPVRLLKPILEK